MNRIRTHAAACAGLALAATSAHAEIATFHATASIEMFSHFDGSDRHPFAGVTENDLAIYHFQYDTTTAPSGTTDSGYVQYTLDGSTSYVQLGANRAYFQTIVITVGASHDGDGAIGFFGSNDALGLTTNVSFYRFSPLASDLPNTFDFTGFNSSHYANSVDNQFLLPIVFGGVLSASITPAPSSALALLGGALFAARRRRQA